MRVLDLQAQLREYQNKILQAAFEDGVAPAEIVSAFLTQSRHKFIPRFRLSEGIWVEVTEDNLQECLPLLYGDHPLVINEEGDSTISQPSFVLKILQLLDLRPGDQVFELGTGSGWNAALMAELVGPRGRVVTVEISETLALQARQRLRNFGLNNVDVICGDGMKGCDRFAPYDRILFTAAAGEIPQTMREQLKEGGRIIFVRQGGFSQSLRSVDYLEVYMKIGLALRLECAIPCRFVPVRMHGVAG